MPDREPEPGSTEIELQQESAWLTTLQKKTPQKTVEAYWLSQSFDRPICHGADLQNAVSRPTAIRLTRLLRQKRTDEEACLEQSNRKRSLPASKGKVVPDDHHQTMAMTRGFEILED